MSTGPRLIWLAWGAITFSALLHLMGQVFHFLRGPVDLWIGYPGDNVLSVVAVVIGSLIGPVIVSRQPRNPVGWLICVATVATAIEVSALQYAAYALLARPEELPGGAVMGWLGNLLEPVASGLAYIFAFLLFPDGRLPSPRWLPVAWLAVGAIVIDTAGYAFQPGPLRGLPWVANPFGVEAAGDALRLLKSSGSYLFYLSIGLAVASLIARARHAQGEERQQLKWISYAAFMFALPYIGMRFFPILRPLSPFAFLGLPLTFAIAVLKYHLYEIDVLIHRTLVYGALTAFLAVVYFASVAGMSELFRSLTGEWNEIATMISTVLVAVLFNPMRRRIQAAVDRRFYRARYNAELVRAAFSARVREEVDPERLNNALLDAIDETMQPAHVSIWLRRKT
jgi:hypothetical protein